MNKDLKKEIIRTLERTKKLIDSKILWSSKPQIYTNSVLIEILILMKDLLKKTEIKFKQKIDFKDDVIITDTVKDVTDLISYFRDACCHENTWHRKHDYGTLAFNTLHGKGVLAKFGDFKIEGKYDDDVVYNMGKQLLYLNRHIETAFNKVSFVLNKIINEQ